MSRSLQDLWAPLTDAIKVFDTHGSAQQLCAQKVREALLTKKHMTREELKALKNKQRAEGRGYWDEAKETDATEEKKPERTQTHSGDSSCLV
jgi:hypothetical protein